MIARRFRAVALLMGASAVVADGQDTHVITGHVYDAHHRAVAQALVGVRRHNDYSPRLMPASEFGPHTPWYAGTFVRAGTDGAFRIEIPASWGVVADSAVDVVALAPDFAPYVSKVASGVATVEVTLASAPWRPYTITARTPDVRPATDAVARAVVGTDDSVVFQVSADPAGRMSFRAPPTTAPPLPVVVSTPGYRPVETEPFQYGDTTQRGITVTLLPAITGVVRDEHGQPSARIGVFWSLGRGLTQTIDQWASGITEPFGGTVTDATGRYTIAPAVHVDPEGKRLGVQSVDGRKFNVVFADSGFMQLAFTQIDPAPAGATTIVTDVTLRPTRAVRIRILEPRLTATTGRGDHIFTVGIEPVPTPHVWDHDTTSSWPIGIARIDYPDSARSGDGSVGHEAVFHLPPGRYRAVANRWPDVDAKGAWFDVPPGTDAFTTPEQRPPVLPIYAMLGKSAPALQATDLGGKPARLADYRGKVVVLDFWGYWCGVCIHTMKTELIPFAHAYAGKPVVVLALHDASVRSRAEYDSVFGRLKRAEFGGQNLPFPVLLDRPTPDQRAIALGERTEGNGATVSTYNVSGFPSTFVIDARGILAERVDLTSDPAQLRRVVDRLLGEATGAQP